MKRLLSVLLVAALLVPAAAQAVWNKDWTVRREVKLDTTAKTGVETKSALSGTTIAIKLHPGNFDFGGAKDDGSDIRLIAADDKTPLKFHVERFDAVDGLGVLWVSVPQILPGTDKNKIWLYAGNPAANAEQDVRGSFDAATAIVMHFDGAAVNKNLIDGASATGTVTLEKAGLMGNSANFAGQPLVLAAVPALRLAPTNGVTVSAWVKPATAADGVLYQQGGVVFALAGGKLVLKGTGADVTGGEVKPGAWQHVALTVGGGKAALYLNGAPVAEGAANLPEVQAEVKVGQGYTGLFDELQVASTPRSAEWVRVAALSQGQSDKLVAVTAEAEGEGEGEGNSYFGILIENLTTDAWVVIIILMVMLLIAVLVMITKTIFVTKTDKDNRLFLQRFREAEDFLSLVSDDKGLHPNASLYRLYKTGVREIEKRFNAARAKGLSTDAVLSGASLDAIKASIDADLVRENHTLNSRIVLLTIAISGGPFLGLLGTVVGVMITFAAIAAAGDVNVNSIAPGIAAALLATVAGLAVAIPALFGYNWLASRIKNISADMQIFVDEFVTRAAETYGN